MTGFAPSEAPASRALLRRSMTQAVEVLDGDISAHATRLTWRAAGEVCVMATGDMGLSAPRDAQVRWRAVLPPEIAAGSAPDGAEVRVSTSPPIDAVIVDRAVALIRACHAQMGPVTLLVHQGGLLQAAQALFERTWASAAAPLAAFGTDTSDPGGPPDPADLQLLRLLLGGFTDEAIASRLEVGARTVQRRVHDLIEAAGVRTRLQLIWHATRRGWI